VATSLAHIPGSGSLLELPRMMSDPARFVRERYEAHGPIFKTRWVRSVVFVVGPEANKVIHITRRLIFSYRLAFKDLAFGRLFDGSLLTEDGEAHQRDRDILQPAMGRLGLTHAFEPVREIWERAAEGIKPGESIDAYEFVRRVTFEVSANALLELGLDDELQTWEPLFQALIDGSMANVPFRIPFGVVDRGMRAREKLIAMLEPRIEAARQKEPTGMMGLLSHHRGADGQGLSNRRIAEHLLLLFWAGYDTTASTGSWLLHELSRAPEWQEKIAVEQGAFAGRQPAMEDLDKQPVTGWVLKEIERLHPAVIFFPRINTEPFEYGGKEVPSGTFLMWTPYMTHRMKELFAEPDAFDPARWDPSKGKAAAPATALVGFGGGPRICLGKAFALLQLKLMLVSLIRRFRVAPAADAKMETVRLPTNRPKDARLTLTAR
jgi:retinoid hydroxylase